MTPEQYISNIKNNWGLTICELEPVTYIVGYDHHGNPSIFIHATKVKGKRKWYVSRSTSRKRGNDYMSSSEGMFYYPDGIEEIDENSFESVEDAYNSFKHFYS